MPKVSLLVIISNQEEKVLKHFFDSLDITISKRVKEFLEDADTINKRISEHIEIELIIANRDTVTINKGIFDIYHHLCNIYIGSAGNDDVKTYIEMIKNASGEYICILNPSVLLEKYWLSNLLDHYEYIPQSGVISISINPNKDSLSVLLNTDDSFSHVLLPDNNCVENIYFFKKQYLEYFPIAYHENMLNVLCIDAIKCGYKNYYLTTTFAITIS